MTNQKPQKGVVRHLVYNFRGVIQQEFPTAAEAKEYIAQQKNPTEYYIDIIFYSQPPV